MGLAQKYLTGMIGLGAGYLVLTNSAGFYKVASGLKNLIAGSETQIITGGKKG